jgi:hypothetical protein
MGDMGWKPDPDFYTNPVYLLQVAVDNFLVFPICFN